MSELESELLKHALDILPQSREAVKNINIEARFISFPFYCNGVLNTLVFDKDVNDFTKIEYEVGVGDGVSFENEKGGYYDEVKKCEIDLTKVESNAISLLN